MGRTATGAKRTDPRVVSASRARRPRRTGEIVMEDLTDTRRDFVEYVRSQLVGPFGGADEVIFDPPNRRYLMGILFPRSVAFAGYMEAEGEIEDENATTGGEESQFSDDPVSAANDFLPASQGLSFFTTANEIAVTVRAALYQTLGGEAARLAILGMRAQADGPTEIVEEDPRKGGKRTQRVWKRQRMDEVRISIGRDGELVYEIWEGRAEVHVRWRPYPRGSLVTVTVVNGRSSDDDHPERQWDDMLLQVEFEVTVGGDAEILEYPAVSLASHDPEEQELRLIHRNARVFAIGHGCAPDWAELDGAVRSVRADVMPVFEIARTRADVLASVALDIAWLADSDIPESELVNRLVEFGKPYADWIDQVKRSVFAFEGSNRTAAEAIVGRLEKARDRILGGVDVFASHPDKPELIRAFRLANEAMLMQMRHSKSDLAGSRHARSEDRSLPGAYPAGATWRPFQLGFFLTVLRGLVDDSDPDRDTVDLIWFPTGGGKTEAYLLVAAFEIFRRRLKYGAAGGGTTVISRYTLSLLTAQQFQRTASTIAACEVLRRRERGVLGSEPISVGLWVGEGTTPNRYSKAREQFDDLRDAVETDDRFLLERCPWCGTEIVPRRHSDDDGAYGIDVTDSSFSFRCTWSSCPFHDRLPVHVVDDDLYAHPPTFLLGTVDKFAQLAWVADAGNLFGRTSGARPPSLILQDELHLLTGPLGTTVGLYETAINLLCEVDGRAPKVIASTATIRRATEQIAGLFGRPVDLFPPTGIDADNSFFAQADDRGPGRLYVGLMAQGHTSDTAVVHTGTALMQAPVDLGLTDIAAKDAYWTLVVYHSSLRELGRTVTIANDDINSRLGALVIDRPRRSYEVDELSSSVPRALQPRLLERLALRCDEPDSIGFLATTNMLSVGVDVGRLGLMLVNGQPKATAEYIQATSRVGRAGAPGLVFGLFRSTKPRDRSHYENFRSFHSSVYRHVEPTSVTPFSPPSRDRALHAALVILVRHKLGMSHDAHAGQILDRLDEVRALADALLDVVARVEPRERPGAAAYLDAFVSDWVDRGRRAAQEKKNLYYQPNGRGQINLIKRFNERADGWPTLGSMRNVDRESLIEVQTGGSQGEP